MQGILRVRGKLGLGFKERSRKRAILPTAGRSQKAARLVLAGSEHRPARAPRMPGPARGAAQKKSPRRCEGCPGEGFALRVARGLERVTKPAGVVPGLGPGACNRWFCASLLVVLLLLLLVVVIFFGFLEPFDFGPEPLDFRVQSADRLGDIGLGAPHGMFGFPPGLCLETPGFEEDFDGGLGMRFSLAFGPTVPATCVFLAPRVRFQRLFDLVKQHHAGLFLTLG